MCQIRIEVASLLQDVAETDDREKLYFLFALRRSGFTRAESGVTVYRYGPPGTEEYSKALGLVDAALQKLGLELDGKRLGIDRFYQLHCQVYVLLVVGEGEHKLVATCDGRRREAKFAMSANQPIYVSSGPCPIKSRPIMLELSFPIDLSKDVVVSEHPLTKLSPFSVAPITHW